MTGTIRFGLRTVLLLAAALLHLESLATVITDGGMNAGYGCKSPYFLCTSSSKTFTYDSPTPFAPASGTLNFDTGNLLLDLDIDVGSATFVSISAADNGIDEIVFTNLNYSATGLGLNDLGGGVYTLGGSITVSGFYQQLFGGSEVVASSAFSSGANVSSGQCTELGGVLNCDFNFGHGQFQLGIGAAPQNRRFQHALNVVSAPEPGTLVLVGGGLLGLLLVRRSAAS